MATIQTAIRLIDQATSPMLNITQALNMTISAFESVESTANGAISGMNFDGVRERINSANMELNETIESIQRNTEEQDNFNESLEHGVKKSNDLMSSIKKMAAAYLSVQTVKKAIGVSDNMALSESRLTMLVDDGGSVQELENKIFASAQRARANYQGAIYTVSKLGLLAGKAFSGNDEIIRFQELMNKNFIIGGSSAQEQASAMYQLTQAMGSGRLQGDEYRSIIENAPLLANAIEDYMVNIKGAKGSMKEWSSEGLLTANVIKAALFNTADAIDAKFSQMPMTFGQIWTNISNNALLAFKPILTSMNEIANSEKFNQLASGITNALVVVGGVILWIFDLITAVGGFMYDNWSLIAPVIYGLATALSYYAGYLAVTKGLELISTGIKIASAVASYLYATATKTQASATAVATAAQYKLNAAMLTSPVTLIIIAIIALIVIIYLVIAAVNKFAGTSISATGAILGAFTVLGAAIWNIVVGVIDAVIQVLWTRFVEPWIGIIEFVLNVFNGGFNSFGDAVKNLLGQIISWFLSLGKVVTKIIDAIFGTDWTGGLNSLQDNVLKWGKNDKAITLSREAPTLNSLTGGKIDRWAYGDAWNAGYTAGENIEKGIANFDPSKLFNTDRLGLGNDVGNIADNTDAMKGSMEITEEELKYLRDIAERDAVNRFTTAEVKVDFGGITNHVSSEIDLDGVVSYLEEKVSETLEVVAEGVHV